MSIKKSKSQLHRENLELKANLKACEEDRALFRQFIKNEMKNQLDNVSNKTYTPADTLIKKIVTLLNTVKPFYIWW